MSRLYLTIEIETLTQLHVGSGEEKRLFDSKFFRTVDGSIIIPGTSLGGVLRARATQIFPVLLDAKPCLAFNLKARDFCTCPVCSLFGQINPVADNADYQSSKLVISNAQLVNGIASTMIRDGVGIDRSTGTARNDKSAKFDYETIPKGTNFKFTIEGIKLTDTEELLMAVLLAEIDEGRIYFGGKSGRGLGRINITSVASTSLKQEINDPASLRRLLAADDWRDCVSADHKWYEKTLIRARKSFDGKNTSFFHIKGELAFESGVLVKDNYIGIGSSYDAIPHLTEVKGKKETYIPGSSIRGILRSQSERIGRTLGHLNNADINKIACDPFAPKQSGEDYCCLACTFFGNIKQGSRLKIGDAWESHQGTMYIQDYLAIDRFTGGGSDGRKFDAVILDRPRYGFEIYIENPAVWEIGWLLLALRDLSEGFTSIGSGSAKGLGQVIIIDETCLLISSNLIEIEEGKETYSGVFKAGLLKYSEIENLIQFENYVTAFNSLVEKGRQIGG